MLEGVLSSFTETQRHALLHGRVGIAGAGGLGSNTAMMLARCGIGHLTIIDGDSVEPSNLNRQHYFPVHIGMPKVEALKAQLISLNPDISIDARMLWLDADTIPSVLSQADLWIEAMDNAESKAMFASLALSSGKTVICGSGMGGFGKTSMKRRIMGSLIVVGDMETDIAAAPPLAPRVIQCAAMQADAALEWILTGTIKVLL